MYLELSYNFEPFIPVDFLEFRYKGILMYFTTMVKKISFIAWPRDLGPQEEMALDQDSLLIGCHFDCSAIIFSILLWTK